MPYYNEIAKGYDELHKEEQLKKLAIIKKFLNPKPTDKLLDVGCGTGICTDWNCITVGIDPSFNLLKHGNNNFIQASGESLPFKDNSFDYVISVTAIHLFKDIDKGLKEIKRVGKDRFILCILKKSSKAKKIKNKIHSLFDVKQTIEEDQDLIYII